MMGFFFAARSLTARAQTETVGLSKSARRPSFFFFWCRGARWGGRVRVAVVGGRVPLGARATPVRPAKPTRPVSRCRARARLFARRARHRAPRARIPAGAPARERESARSVRGASAAEAATTRGRPAAGGVAMARDYEVKFASPTNEYDPEKPNCALRGSVWW